MAETKRIDISRWLSIGLKFIPAIFSLIVSLEKIAGATGEQKRQAILDAVADGLPMFELAAGKDALKDPKVLEAVGAFIDAAVAVQNAIVAAQDAVNKD